MEILLLTIVLGFVLTLVLGRFVLAELRRLKAGQEIREDGPKWHAGKAGTPTMGGIMFIIGVGITVFVLGWNQMLKGKTVAEAISYMKSVVGLNYARVTLNSCRIKEPVVEGL